MLPHRTTVMSISNLGHEPPQREAHDTPSSQDVVSPGALRGRTWLTLQTRVAARLVKGRPATAGKPPIIGLIGFANLLRPIWQGARGDDPYADWWLVKAEQALTMSGEAMEAECEALGALVQREGALEMTPASSVQPTRVALQFANPYAYRGAQLLARYDGFARDVLMARHVGLLGREPSERSLYQGARWVRRAFVSALGYRFVGATRVDLAQQTAKAA